MHTEETEHLTQREWREVLRWRAWQAQIALDKAIEAQQKAGSSCRTEGTPSSVRLDESPSGPLCRVGCSSEVQ